jgi:hypothetical protein
MDTTELIEKLDAANTKKSAEPFKIKLGTRAGQPAASFLFESLADANIVVAVFNALPSILSALREQQRMREASKKALGLLHECFRQLDGVKQGVCKTCGRDRAIWQACETGCLSSRLSYAIHEMTLARAALKESEVKE